MNPTPRKTFLQGLSSIWGFRFFLKSKTWLAYALKLLLLLAVPYLWVLIFGFVDTLVNAYTFMLYFTFIGAVVLLAFNLFLIACATIIMCNPVKVRAGVVTAPKYTVVKPTQRPKKQKENKPQTNQTNTTVGSQSDNEISLTQTSAQTEDDSSKN